MKTSLLGDYFKPTFHLESRDVGQMSSVLLATCSGMRESEEVKDATSLVASSGRNNIGGGGRSARTMRRLGGGDVFVQ